MRRGVRAFWLGRRFNRCCSKSNARPPRSRKITRSSVGVEAVGAACGKRHAVDDAYPLIVSDQLIAQPHPQMLFDRPQNGGLSYKGRAMHVGKTREEMGRVLSEEGKERFVLTDSQVRANHFHDQHFAIPELGHGACAREAVVAVSLSVSCRQSKKNR